MTNFKKLVYKTSTVVSYLNFPLDSQSSVVLWYIIVGPLSAILFNNLLKICGFVLFQAKIQGLKKTSSKGDKKKKKEVAEEIAKLEAELDSRHEQEIAEIKNSSGDSKEVSFPDLSGSNFTKLCGLDSFSDSCCLARVTNNVKNVSIKK
jgi:hypothetical protein